MDESKTLDALANILTDLAQKPYDVALHAQHIRLAQSAEGMESEVQSAREMMSDFLAAGEEVWSPLIEEKQKSLDFDASDDLAEPIQELLALYARAEADYLSIPILQKHLEFILSGHSHYASTENKKPETLQEIFSTEWTRSAIAEVANKGIGHLTQSHLLWDARRDWELEILETAPSSEKEACISHVEKLLLDRLRQPHSNSEETLQAYSTFTTNYKPPQDYETLLVAASKLRAQAIKSYERRERSENALIQSKFALESYARYLASERRAKYLDSFVMNTVYERAIAEAAKRRFNGETGAEEVLRMFWTGYIDALRINKVEEQMELTILKRAVRSVPGSGEVWARYMRYLERLADSEEAPEGRATVSDVFDQALGMNLLQSDVEQIIPVTLARAGFEKRRIEAGNADDDAFSVLIRTLESGIDMVRQASPLGDPRLRLEKYLTEIYLRLADVPDSAISVWQLAAKHYKTSYLAWISYTDVLIKQDRHDQARKVFDEICMKNLDWSEAIWEAWISFEQLYGSVEEIDYCLDKIEKAQYQVNTRRAKEMEKASYQAMQAAAEQQAAVVPAADVIAPVDQVSHASVPMDVDIPSTPEGGSKRKAEEVLPVEHKKARTEETKPLPLKRDRENSTVFVADLPTQVTEDELKELFRDCGNVREIKITQLPDALVATVEFFERDSVPAALTKDKKRLRGGEVAVHLAWKSTLYVTNFPEKADDTFMRDLFGKFGTIFDVRWPSKKFKNTRRFCYVQYTSPSSAEKSLELHGRELEPGQPMSVLLSNPERKKERTDHDANEREIYVAGLSKFTIKADLEKLFNTYGGLKEVRMATEIDGTCKGFAFVEFEEEKYAQAALAANNYELKKRRIAVTLADSRVRARNRHITTDTGLSRVADTRSRSVRIRNLPAGTQEGLLQQILEKIALVKRVEVFTSQKEAMVELENAAEAGKLLLRTEPIVFDGNTLEITEEGRDKGGSSRPSAPPPKTGGLFIPRTAASRPRAGLGSRRGRGSAIGHSTTPRSSGDPQSTQPTQGKGQDDFRKMLGGK